MRVFRRMEEGVEDLFEEVADAVVPSRRAAMLGMGRAGIALLAAPLAIAGAMMGGLAGWLMQAPRIPEFESYDPPQATTILDRDGRPLASLFEQRREVVPIRAVSPLLGRAFVAIEDERFGQHMGIDPLGILRAAGVNLLRRKASQGASTITQQTARNLLPWLGQEKTIRRKAFEVLTALQMERLYTKDQILEVYMNHIYLGSGAYGVEAASRTYFGKGADALSVAELATIAGLPQRPEKASPLNNPDLALARRNQVLQKMWQLGDITDRQFDQAIVEPMAVAPDRVAAGRAAYFVDAVRRQLANHPALEGNTLQRAGWKVRTTVDPALQELAESTLREGLEAEEQEWLAGRQARYAEHLEEPASLADPAAGQVRMARLVRHFGGSLVVELPGGWRADLDIPDATASYFALDESVALGDGVDVEVVALEPHRKLFRGRLLPQQRLQGALVCLDAATGDVRALAGGRDYTDRENNGFFNRAFSARRQAGSTMKPLFFAAALERGFTPASTVSDTPISFPNGYAPKNYDKEFRGTVTVQQSLEQSRNIPTIRLAQEVGLKNAIAFVRRFQRLGAAWDMPLEIPVALGTTPVTPLELAGAYQALANGGAAHGPRLVEGIWNQEDREGISPEEAKDAELLEPEAAAELAQMMAGVMTHGTGRKVREALPESLRNRVAGKSGTTNDNRDAWFAGYTPHEVIVVWVGFDQNVPLAPGRTGSKAAGPIWAAFASAAWERHTPEEQQAPLRLPAGWALHPVAEDGVPLSPGEAVPEPPVLRAVRETELPPPAPAPQLAAVPDP